MNKIIFLFTAILFCTSCGKETESVPSPAPITTPTVSIKQASRVSFSYSDASGYPTRIYAMNTNTSETFFVYNKNPAGTYNVAFRGLGGRQIVGTPRSGNTNVVSFDPGVNDTLVVSNNGIETMMITLINDNLNILNGGIHVDRLGFETNEQARVRLNNYVSNVMATQKFKPF